MDAHTGVTCGVDARALPTERASVVSERCEEPRSIASDFLLAHPGPYPPPSGYSGYGPARILIDQPGAKEAKAKEAKGSKRKQKQRRWTL